MNKRKAKKQYKKELKKPKLVIKAPGCLNGYACPTCGELHCREPYCRACGQNLCYDKENLNKPNMFKPNKKWREASKTFKEKWDRERAAQVISYFGYDKTDFSEQQVHHIVLGIKNEFSTEQFALFVNPKFSSAQMTSILWGLCGFIEEKIPGGLSVEQVAVYAKPEFSDRQMDKIRDAFADGLSMAQVRTFASPSFSAEQMKAVIFGYLDGLSIEEVSTYAKPELDFHQMFLKYESLINEKEGDT